jgi:hypothetical protein
MRRIAIPILLSLFLIQSAPVATQPFGPFPRPPAVLNGCTESALFAILNSQAGQACLQYLPRYANDTPRFSIYCRAGRWGCCIKPQGYPNCKIEEAIPTRPLVRLPATQ